MAPSLRLLSIFLLFAFAVGTECASYDLGYEPQDLASEEALRSLFTRWTEVHRKFYNGLGENDERFSVFKDNVLYIHEYNEQHESHKLGLNEYADLTHDQFKEHRLGYSYDRVSNLLRMPRGSFSHGSVTELPEEIDWREKGAVTPVKNQARCGSCWAFSTTGAVEGINQLVTGSLTSLSEQELVDCDKLHDMGCQGGLMDFAFQFIIDNGGLDTEEDYPYKGYNERCDVDKENTRVVTIDDYEDVPANSESSLKQAVSQQPVSVAIEADKRPFQFYRGGVFDGECGTALNHGVLAVGYGVEDGTPYWLVKNSWGPGWGLDGYIKIKRDTAPEGLCGIAKVASYPLKKGPNPPPGPPTPHPPAPEPEQCDATHTCNEGTTCCCSIPLGKFCLAWGCCPMDGATCCEDHRHCCPREYPVCHLEQGLCAKGEDVLGGSVPMVTKEPAHFHFNWAALTETLGLEPVKETLSFEAVEEELENPVQIM